MVPAVLLRVPPSVRISLGYGGAVLAGVVVGALAAFTHATTVVLVGNRMPVGMVVALAASGGLFTAAGVLLARAGAALCAGGWVVTVLLLAAQRPEGDLVISSSPSGWTLIVVGGLLAFVSMALAPPRPGGWSAARQRPRGRG